ncbi:MAG: LytTR family transcriptional regulator [Clostridia bacterium]|nr:LytTR family transcriptional regulator [Clostridia bacterium]
MKVRIELDPSCRTPEVVIRTDQKTPLVDKLVSAIERIAKSDTPRIAVFDGSAALLLDQRDIFRVYTAPRKLMVCSGKGTFEARCSLQEIERALDEESFVRISRFEIINMEKVAGFDVSVSGTIKVAFDDGSSTWVARRYVRMIEQRLEHLYAKGGRADE